MIDVYTWTTGNGRKVPIFLEETGTPYRLHMVDIHNGGQSQPEFIKINPNRKIPAIIDQDGPGGKPITLFESGAILIYLADKIGQFIPKDPAGRYHTIEWVMFQMANIGPMLGQAHHFRGKAPQVEYGVKRYTDEATRLWKVMDGRLGEVALPRRQRLHHRRHGDLCLAAQSEEPGPEPRRLSEREALVHRHRRAAPPCSARTRRWKTPRRNTRR